MGVCHLVTAFATSVLTLTIVSGHVMLCRHGAFGGQPDPPCLGRAAHAGHQAVLHPPRGQRRPLQVTRHPFHISAIYHS